VVIHGTSNEANDSRTNDTDAASGLLPELSRIQQLSRVRIGATELNSAENLIKFGRCTYYTHVNNSHRLNWQFLCVAEHF
jgi:hypothetical protein